jgi:hypothetical protein
MRQLQTFHHMAQPLVEIFNHVLMITGFVFVMMLLIEYLNVLTRGMLARRTAASHFGKYLFAALMGAIPGCLGAFVIVAMYTHRLTSAGALATVMIATSGDEAFVMLSMFPRQALVLMGILFVLGVAAGMLTDLMLRNKQISGSLFGRDAQTGQKECQGFEIHENEPVSLLPRGGILAHWRSHTSDRIILSIILLFWMLALASGYAGHIESSWMRISILLVSALALFIVATVPAHFLHEHLWNHVTRKHIPGIFLWTFGALLVVHFVVEYIHLEALIRHNVWAIMVLASLVGVIPQSGPHLLFVTLFAAGTIPFTILLVNSIVQDGHGMLPLLSHSPRTFLIIKAINLLAGIVAGAVILTFTRLLL